MASFRINELQLTLAVLLTVCVVASACSSQETVSPPTIQTTATHTYTEDTTTPPITKTTHTHADLQEGPYLGNYSISEVEFGTQTTVTVSDNMRTIRSW